MLPASLTTWPNVVHAPSGNTTTRFFMAAATLNDYDARLLPGARYGKTEYSPTSRITVLGTFGEFMAPVSTYSTTPSTSKNTPKPSPRNGLALNWGGPIVARYDPGALSQKAPASIRGLCVDTFAMRRRNESYASLGLLIASGALNRVQGARRTGRLRLSPNLSGFAPDKEGCAMSARMERGFRHNRLSTRKRPLPSKTYASYEADSSR